MQKGLLLFKWICKGSGKEGAIFMPILRKSNKERYTVVDNSIIRDTRLNLKTFGLLVKMLALPDQWEFCEAGLFKILDEDGRTAIRTALKNLEEFGYLKRERLREADGTIRNTEWTIFENSTKPPKAENPILDNQGLENKTQYNTNGSNLNELKTKDYIITDNAYIFFNLYEQVFNKEHRTFKGTAAELEDYETDCLEEIITEFFNEQKYQEDKCTLDYFIKVLDRYK